MAMADPECQKAQPEGAAQLAYESIHAAHQAGADLVALHAPRTAGD